MRNRKWHAQAHVHATSSHHAIVLQTSTQSVGLMVKHMIMNVLPQNVRGKQLSANQGALVHLNLHLLHLHHPPPVIAAIFISQCVGPMERLIPMNAELGVKARSWLVNPNALAPHLPPASVITMVHCVSRMEMFIIVTAVDIVDMGSKGPALTNVNAKDMAGDMVNFNGL